MLRFLAVTAFIILAFSASTRAACPQFDRLVRAEFFNSDAVVEAELVKINQENPKNQQDYFIYTLRTTRIIRGGISPVFEVYEENSSGRAGFDWRRKTRYLLFLERIEGSGRWFVDGCGNSNRLSSATRTLEIINSFESSNAMPVVRGIVTSATRDLLADGVSIDVVGAGGHFRTTTDRFGAFKVRVPPGNYKVKASKAGWDIQPDVLTYEDPRNVTLAINGCAQLEFLGRPSEK